eukprot:m51a1_g1942 putative 3-oxoacyl-[acyl-carrier protein] reductase (259) ;mRNA; r:939869-940645
MDGKVVVITGASSGIGAALAEVVGAHGGVPVLVARREPELRAVASRCGPRATVAVADCTQRAQVLRVRDEAIARHGRIDVWVNNAGRGITVMPSEATEADLDAMVACNVKSALFGTQAALEHFYARGCGHVINVSSLAGRLPMLPCRAVYSSAKHMLNCLTAAFRMEAMGRCPAVRVSTFTPGGVATDFGTSSLHGGFDSHKLPGAQTAEEVALVIYDLMLRPRADVYSRPQMASTVAAYFSAPDMQEVESNWLKGIY